MVEVVIIDSSGNGQGVSVVGNPKSRINSQVFRNAVVDVSALRYAIEVNDNGAFNAAKQISKRLYLPAGLGSGPNGEYLLSSAVLEENLEIFGDGQGLTIIRPVGVGDEVFFALSDTPTSYIENVHIHDCTIHGYVEDEGFSEQVHLMRISGVRNCKIYCVEFKGFRGDGLYLGSGVAVERHNELVRIESCTFDGVNRDNRNAVSVIDCTGLVLEHNMFKNCTRNTMPGPVDIEPNANAYHRVSDITISNNQFVNCGGNVGQVSITIPSATPTPKRIAVVHNTFSGYLGSGADISLTVNRTLTADDDDMALTIAHNRGISGLSPLQLFSGKGITIVNNVWQDYTFRGFIGFNGTNDLVRDVIWFNRLIRVGTGAGADLAGLFIGKVNNLRLGGEVYKCGPAASNGYPIRFIGSASSDYVNIDDLRITKNTSQTIAIRASGHTQTQANNRFTRSLVDGLTNEFLSTAW